MKNEKFGYYDDIRCESSIKELEMMKKFKSYNIIRERVELYKDFTINLLHYIHDTYLGNDYIKTEQEMLEHFTWCYGKVLEEFYDEEFSFYENEELFEYFYTYYQIEFPIWLIVQEIFFQKLDFGFMFEVIIQSIIQVFQPYQIELIKVYCS